MSRPAPLLEAIGKKKSRAQNGSKPLLTPGKFFVISEEGTSCVGSEKSVGRKALREFINLENDAFFSIFSLSESRLIFLF
jgi:hypothetical protein